jgi:uncharacterized protein YcbX
LALSDAEWSLERSWLRTGHGNYLRHQKLVEDSIPTREISVWETGQSARREFSIENCEPLNRWLSDFFGFRVSLKHEPRSGCPDDSDAFGPTIVSDASLREVQSWYPTVNLTNVRRRFRTNVELEGGEAFCEDGLFGAPGELKPFQLGAVRFLGHNPCQRCVVPTPVLDHILRS